MSNPGECSFGLVPADAAVEPGLALVQVGLNLIDEMLLRVCGHLIGAVALQEATLPLELQ